MDERTHLSIGEVLSLLRDEFPDITISKIRFLESQGLVDPERTPSGYRKFYDDDVERLRWILRQQRELFLPLKVIKGRLPSTGAEPPAPEDVTPLGGPRPESPTPLGPSRPGVAADRQPVDGVAGSGHQVGAHAGAAPSAGRSRESGASGPGPAAEGLRPAGGGRTGLGGPGSGGQPAGPGGWPGGSGGAEASGRPARGGSGPTAGGAGASSAARGPAGAGSGEAGPGPAGAGSGAGRGPAGPGSPAGPAMSAAGSDRTGPGSRPAPSGPRPAAGDTPVLSGTGPSGADRAVAAAGGGPASSGAGRPTGPDGSPDAGPREPSAGTTGTGRSRSPAPPSGQAGGQVPSAPAEAPGGDTAGPVIAPDPSATDDTAKAVEESRAGPGAVDLADTVAEVNLTAAELAVSCGLSVALIRELERFGLVSGRDVGGTTYYDAEAQRLTQLAAAFAAHGVEARHLRMYKNAAERESGLFEQVVMPLIKQRNPNARQQAAGTLEELAALGRDLREILLRRALRDAF